MKKSEKIDYKDPQKSLKFKEFDEESKGDSRWANFYKSCWLTDRGNYYAQQDQSEQAISDFKEAIMLTSNHIPAYISLGITYNAQNAPNEAINILNLSLEKLESSSGINAWQIHNQKFVIYFTLGLTYKNIGDNKKATEFLSKSLKENDELSQDQVIKENEELKEVGIISEESETEHKKQVENIKDLISKLKD